MMSVYDDRVWLAHYNRRRPSSVGESAASIVDAFAKVVADQPDRPILHYFDKSMSASELDRISDAFAVALQDNEFRPGDRAVVYLQNIPQFLIAQLGIWKAGGIAVSANPMYRGRELADILGDSGATVLITLHDLYRDVAAEVLADSDIRVTFTTSALDLQMRGGGVLADVVRVECTGTIDMMAAIELNIGRVPIHRKPSPHDVAVLTYTSGTTGPPKGAMATHRNLLCSARTYRDWIGIDESDVIFGVAPLFHITGIVGHSALTLFTGATLVLTYRFDATDAVDTIARHQATFTVGSITVFIALMNASNVSRESLASLTKIYSGGAPIPPSMIDAFRAEFGHTIHNIYGLTETTSPAIAVPYGMRAPVDPDSGAASVGVPVYDTVVRVVDEENRDVPACQIGELVISGPQVVPGYWQKPEATAEALTGGALRTGDVGFMDVDGWFFIVDRKKDQINASGFKVWPREVEDVLYEHPAVREAAVVGVPDEYRGETVKAFISVRPGTRVTSGELVAFARERLAAYKAPRDVVILDDIPKTASGKILRRQLR